MKIISITLLLCLSYTMSSRVSLSSNQHGDKEFIEMAENADCMLIYYSCIVYVDVYLF